MNSAVPTKAEKETEEAVTKAITENGTKNVAQGILKHAPDVIESDAEVRAAKKKVAKAEARSTSRMDGNGELLSMMTRSRSWSGKKRLRKLNRNSKRPVNGPPNASPRPARCRSCSPVDWRCSPNW